MPIQPPLLDDRRFDDLVADMVARIPAHTPEWTNPRPGDPGRTLIELFAWLGDALLYRVNLIPERQRMVFLRLLGLGLRPARAAGTVVQLAYAQPTELGAATLAAGAAVKGPVPFETRTEVTVLPVTAEAYIKRALDDAERARLSEVISGLQRIHRVTGAAAPYETLRVFAGERAEAQGVDVFAASADRALWLALLAPPAPRGTPQPTVNDQVRAALGGSAARVQLSVGVVPALQMPALFEDIAAPAPVPVVWEVSTRGRTAYETDYLSVEPVADSGSEGAADTTRGLTRAGTLRLPLPAKDFLWAPSNDVVENPAAGVGDAPPRVDDEERAGRIVAWLRLRPRPGADVRRLPLSWIGINAVEIDQRRTLSAQVLGASTGAPDQRFRLPDGSVEAETLAVQVEEPSSGWRVWNRVDDLAAISDDPHVAREARVFELDAAAGKLRFGDGVRGRIPEGGMRVRLGSGRFGGGAAGNLPPLTLTEVSGRFVGQAATPALKVSQPLPTQGGADAETLDEAQRRIPALLRHRDRAVTALDYERLAREAPGVDVGRVMVLPRFMPRDRRFEVPGVVSVMALPALPLSGSPNPRPDRPFLERLHAHLAPRAPLATELYVIGCEYVPLGLATAVSLRDGYGREAVLYDVREALKRLLWPLAPGGTDGGGWTLGRDVREREVEVEISRVPGVREVLGLTLFRKGVGEGGPQWQLLPRPAGGAQVLPLLPWQLPELLTVVVADELSGLPSNLSAAPNPFALAQAVAVPVVPELC
jgi:predicted phage baseplate assembly protein